LQIAQTCKALLRPIYLSVLGHRNYRRFAIVGHARTGSNYLLNGLRSLKSVRMEGEIFAGHNREIGKHFDPILSTFFRKERRRIKASGFKLFYYHLMPDEWDKFLAHPEFAVIHLTRKNRLRTIVSLDIAKATNQWASSQASVAEPARKTVSLDASTLIERLEHIENQENLARERFKHSPMLELTYEELVGNPDEAFRRVSRFLDIDDIDVGKIELSRQNPEGLRDLIANYAEVHALLANTRFAGYLNE